MTVNVLVCSILAGLRVGGVTSIPFQAAAHCYAAPLMVIGFMRLWGFTWRARYYPATRSYWRLAWALALVELYTALHQRGLIPF